MVSSRLSNNWYRGFIQGKTRIVLAWIFTLLLGFSSRKYPEWHGILICFIGATLRFWASGYLQKDSKPAVGGPYAFVRNPLYLGTYLMAIGIAMAIENWWFFWVCTIFFAAIYHYIILDEEVKLRRIFGEPYRIYQNLVPRFFPRPLPAPQKQLTKVNEDRSQLRYSWKIAMKNKAYEAYLSFLGLTAFVTAIAYLWKSIGVR